MTTRPAGSPTVAGGGPATQVRAAPATEAGHERYAGAALPGCFSLDNHGGFPATIESARVPAGGLVENNWEVNVRGEGYSNYFDPARRSDIQGRLDRLYASKVRPIEEEYAKLLTQLRAEGGEQLSLFPGVTPPRARPPVTAAPCLGPGRGGIPGVKTGGVTSRPRPHGGCVGPLPFCRSRPVLAKTLSQRGFRKVGWPPAFSSSQSTRFWCGLDHMLTPCLHLVHIWSGENPPPTWGRP